METVKTKICTDSECPHKGKPQPIKEFYKKGAHSERVNQCKTCKKRRAMETYYRKADKEGGFLNWNNTGLYC